MGFFSRKFLVFLKTESKKRRCIQPGKLMAKSRSQAVKCPALNEPPGSGLQLHCILTCISGEINV